MIRAYLAGAIRTLADFKWRKELSEEFAGRLIGVSPSDIGVTDWKKLREFKPSALMTYQTDLALIDQSQLIIANLEAFTEGYPCVGTLVELGYAKGKGIPIVALAPESLRSHPFMAFHCMGVFTSKEPLYNYLTQYLEVLEGTCRLYPQS